MLIYFRRYCFLSRVMRYIKSFPKKHNLLFIVTVGLILSLTNAIWAFLLSISESINGNFFVVAFFMALGLFILPLFLLIIKRERFRFAALPAITGIVFGIANGVLLSIFTYKDSVVVYSFISPTVIVFILLELLVNKARINKTTKLKLIFGGALAAIGFLSLSFLGLNVSLVNLYDVAISVFLIVLYGTAGFLLTETGLRSKSTLNPATNIGLFELLAMLLFLPFGYRSLSFNGVDLALLAGIIVSIGVMISFSGYASVRKGKNAVPYSSIIYILSEMETLFLLVFYSVFVGRLNAYIILSIILITAAVWYLSRESNTALEN